MADWQLNSKFLVRVCVLLNSFIDVVQKEEDKALQEGDIVREDSDSVDGSKFW